MALFLVQHGKCLSEEIDPERSLSPEGLKEVETIASVAKGYKVPARVIAHSGKKRALQTAEIFAQALAPEDGIIEISGIKPLDEVKAFADRVDNSTNMMLVGHLPFLEKLLSFLVAGNENERIFKLQNGGVVCLDFTDEDGWFIRWALMPNLSLAAAR